MKSQTVSVKPTMTLASLSTRLVEKSPQTGTTKCEVFYAKAIAKGRQWVARTFYADRPGIAQLRLRNGWSQAELARRAETSQPYIARLEQGKVDPQISTAQKIAKALGVSIEVFAQALSPEAKA